MECEGLMAGYKKLAASIAATVESTSSSDKGSLARRSA